MHVFLNFVLILFYVYSSHIEGSKDAFLLDLPFEMNQCQSFHTVISDEAIINYASFHAFLPYKDYFNYTHVNNQNENFGLRSRIVLAFGANTIESLKMKMKTLEFENCKNIMFMVAFVRVFLPCDRSDNSDNKYTHDICKDLCISVAHACRNIMPIDVIASCDKMGQHNCVDLKYMTKHSNISQYLIQNGVNLPGSGECPKELRKDDHQYLKLRNCGLPCRKVLYSRKQYEFSRKWSLIWASICFVCSFFTLLTYMIDMERFGYPERPIVFLAACYIFIAACHIVGYLMGDLMVCRDDIVVQHNKVWSCTVSFIILYYFLMASALWWVILSIAWFLSAGFKWSSEALERHSLYFHLLAWFIPGVQTAVVVFANEIDGDDLTGTCFTGISNQMVSRTLVIAPLAFYFILGCVFLLGGFISLFRIRSFMKLDGRETDRAKVEKLIARIGVFSILYTIPSSVLLVCFIYDQAVKDEMRKSFVDSCGYSVSNCDAQNFASTNHFAIVAIKTFMTLIVGITSAFWVCSTKTLQSWKLFVVQVFCCKICSSPQEFHGVSQPPPQNNLYIQTKPPLSSAFV
uniref:Frizzled-4 n=1 Tax=Hofstenia miamia TaxID=442651 RepID=A0A068CRP3_HOFMI|nr:frizzled-4 [Hofstenia miamia]